MGGDGLANREHDVLGLNYGEHLLIWAMRRLVVRPEVCRVVEREFADACRDDAAEVLGTFRVFLGTLSYTARRRICIGHPGSFGLTADERGLVGLIAAAQNDDQSRLDAVACWFARSDAQPHLAIAARALASAFAAHQLWLAAPPLRPTAPTGRPHLRLVR
jgi:hypothetical protein